MFSRRETYPDRSDTASDTALQFESAASSKSREPLEFHLMWRAGGKVHEARFRATAATRGEEMQRLGVSVDNSKYALKSRGAGRDWCAPIGTDEALKDQLRRQR